MLELKIIYNDNSVGFARINATEEIAKRFYEGHYFNVGTVNDDIKKCIKIEILRER